MRLNCGPTSYDKFYAKQEACKVWHPFFALWPRRITGTNECAWLETIRRRGEYVGGYGGSYWEWEYSTPERSCGQDDDGSPSGPH